MAFRHSRTTINQCHLKWTRLRDQSDSLEVGYSYQMNKFMFFGSFFDVLWCSLGRPAGGFWSIFIARVVRKSRPVDNIYSANNGRTKLFISFDSPSTSWQACLWMVDLISEKWYWVVIGSLVGQQRFILESTHQGSNHNPVSMLRDKIDQSDAWLSRC